jgi:ubiquinone/menaquinone biosynthesis C-methylase UbiE
MAAGDSPLFPNFGPMSEDRGPFEAAARKERISEGWDALAEKWDSWAPVVDTWFDPATKALLEMVRLKPGDHVLELAAGSGGLTLHLARVVGVEGRVIATDVGPNMVKLTARNARAAGLSNVVARVMDGETPDVSWASMDVVVCRQGFMFFSDPGAALQRLILTLRPGGSLGLTVFSTPVRNGFMATALSILTRWSRPPGAPAPPSEGPGPFSLGESGMLESMMQATGFVEVECHAVSSPLRLPSLEDLLRFYHDILGDLVEDLPTEVQQQAWNEVGRACQSYVGPGSDGAPCEILIVSGRRPLVQRATH